MMSLVRNNNEICCCSDDYRLSSTSSYLKASIFNLQRQCPAISLPSSLPSGLMKFNLGSWGYVSKGFTSNETFHTFFFPDYRFSCFVIVFEDGRLILTRLCLPNRFPLSVIIRSKFRLICGLEEVATPPDLSGVVSDRILLFP